MEDGFSKLIVEMTVLKQPVNPLCTLTLNPKTLIPNKKIIFVTGNKKKLEEVVAILGNDFGVESKSMDLPELQGDDTIEIAKEKCKLAADVAKGPVICEDTSLCYNALVGLPGPYIKWFLQKIGLEGLNKIIAGYEDKSAYALCVFTFSKGPGHAPVVFEGRTDGKIVPARGPRDFGWDPVFEVDGYNKTYAELDKDIKNAISHRAKALQKLKIYLHEHVNELS